MLNQTETNNLNCLTDPTFNKVYRFFEDITSFSKYYTPKDKMKWKTSMY